MLLGVASGLAFGLPAMIDRIGLDAVARLEDKLQVAIGADRVDWSLDGELVVEGLTVVDRWAPADEPPVLRAARVEVDADVSLFDHRVRLLRVRVVDAELDVVRRAQGPHNLARIVRGLRSIFAGGAGGGGGGGGGGLSMLDRALPTVTFERTTVRVDAPTSSLPLGLEVPDHISFTGGELKLVPDGEGEDATVTLTGEFEETSLDPGHGLGIEVAATLAGHPRAVGVRFDRPVRFYLGRRVAGVRAARWTPQGFALGQLQLSVPLDPDKRYETVGAAATVERVYLSPEPREILRRLGEGLPAEGDLGPLLRRAVGALDSVEITAPALVARVDGAGRHSFEDIFAPLSLPDAAPAPPPLAGHRGGEGVVALLTDATLAASVRLTQGATRRDAPLSPRRRVIERLGALEARVDGLAATVVAALKALPLRSLKVTDAHLELLAGQARVTVERLDLEAARAQDAVTLEAALVVPEVTRRPATFSARVAPSTGELEAELSVAGLPLVLVAEALPLPLVSAAGDGVLHDSRVSFSWRDGGAHAEAKGFVEVTDAVVTAPALAKEALRGLDLGFDFDVVVARDDGTFTVQDSRLTFGDVNIDLDLEIADYRRKPRISLDATLPETPVQAIVDSLPRAMMRRLDGLTVGGTLSWALSAKVDTFDLDALVIDSRPDLRGFVVRSMGEHVGFDVLRQAFSYDVLRADGSPGRRFAGPLTGSWVPYEDISPYLVKAVTTTEDGRFYRHKGLSIFAMKESLITNLKQGRFARGASTITQQLVKNLFLGPEKTVARKLQEV
ncbi:MAG: hypothetical protein CSA66_02090, partial [Proteobacteria bacterium]